MIKFLDWIIAMTRIKIFCQKNSFSKRDKLFDALHPRTECGKYRVKYPDAMLLITNKMVATAIKTTNKEDE